jgi:2'-5' RNA ligase
VRLFVAVEVAGPAARPTGSPEHLTLRFLGEVAPDRVEPLAVALRHETTPLPPFEFVVDGVGAFPSADRPRVVWRDVREGREALLALAGAVRTAVVRAGLPDDPTPFVPHVTLFRVRSPRDRARAVAVLSGAERPPPATRVLVTSIALKASELTPHGAEHRTLVDVGLGPDPT